jgi:hypothetical protein
MESKYGFTGCLACFYPAMDALYEICDAEFAADQHINAEFCSMCATHKECECKFALSITHYVRDVAKREHLYEELSYSSGPLFFIAKKISHDWIARHNAELHTTHNP